MYFSAPFDQAFLAANFESPCLAQKTRRTHLVKPWLAQLNQTGLGSKSFDRPVMPARPPKSNVTKACRHVRDASILGSNATTAHREEWESLLPFIETLQPSLRIQKRQRRDRCYRRLRVQSAATSKSRSMPKTHQWTPSSLTPQI